MDLNQGTGNVLEIQIHLRAWWQFMMVVRRVVLRKGQIARRRAQLNVRGPPGGRCQDPDRSVGLLLAQILATGSLLRRMEI